MCKEIPLSQGKVALVDDADFEWLSQWKWQYDKNGYVVRSEYWYDDAGKRHSRKVMMHRFILNAPKGIQVDHRFHNRLDNRRSEIRLVTPLQNHVNSRPVRNSSSQYKGVSRYPKGGWRASIMVNKRRRHLGIFANETDAALAYNAAASEAWGEYAWLNPVAPPTWVPTALAVP